ncbi:MAG: ATP-binding protein [Coxiellaceae bacterium]|nr:ATP-binding protein [Coxiellaceae bacterium]
MEWFINIIAYLFSLALIINAILFIFQLFTIWQQRSANDVSLGAFCGFFLIQGVTTTYALLHSEHILAYGTMISMITCGSVIVSIMYFRFFSAGGSRDNEPSLQEIVENIPANVYWMDRKGNFLGCNNQMLKLLQLKSTEDYRGKTYKDLYEKNHIDIIKQTDQEVMSTDKAIALEEVAFPYKVYWSNKIPLHNRRNEVIGLLGVSIDITDRKKMERDIEHEKKRAETANYAKTEFIYNMRHDIRTPLTNMVGLTNILITKEEDPEKKEIIQDLLTSSEALLDLFNDLLTFSSFDEGAHNVQSKPFNLKEVIFQIQSIMSAAIQSKGIDLNIDYDDKIPDSLLGDQMRIHRILLNLVGNAIKFTDQGSVTLKTSLEEVQTKQVILKLSIEDSGMGIPQNKIGYIFGKFNRLEKSATGNHPGTGLGLSIVKRFLQDIGGDIHVDSTIGVGSCFTCTIPFEIPHSSRSEAYETRSSYSSG